MRLLIITVLNLCTHLFLRCRQSHFRFHYWQVFLVFAWVSVHRWRTYGWHIGCCYIWTVCLSASIETEDTIAFLPVNAENEQMKRMQLKHRINICDKKLKVLYWLTTNQSLSMMKSLLQNTVNNSSPARRRVTSMNLNALPVREAFYSFTGSIYSQCTLPPYYTV